MLLPLSVHCLHHQTDAFLQPSDILPVSSRIDKPFVVCYDGYLIQEFEGVEDCRMAIRAGLDYMKRLLTVLPRYAWQPPENAE